ncbi:MAG: putative phosphoglycerate mutase [Myxococcota bacterium]|jgi:probable phosphoglycerate mutase
MSIYLIRHGQTSGNASRRLQTPDTPLNEEGLEQARRLGERLRDAGIGYVLSSDLTRAQQTAEAVVRITGAPLVLEPLLQERNFGDLRGQLYSDVGPNLFDDTFDPPGGESGDVFRARAHAAWQRVVAFAEEVADTGHLAVVTHGLLYRVLYSRHIAADANAEAPIVGNTAVSIIEPGSPHAVSLLACTAHLD